MLSLSVSDGGVRWELELQELTYLDDLQPVPKVHSVAERLFSRPRSHFARLKLEPVEGGPNGLHEFSRHAADHGVVVEGEFLAALSFMTAQMEFANKPRDGEKTCCEGC